MKRSRIRDYITIALVFVAAVLVWQFIVPFFIQSFLVPPPSDFLGLLLSPKYNWTLHTGVTLYEALVGFALGTVAGVLLSVLIAESAFLNKILMPYIVLVELTPKVAVAPVLYIVLGFNDEARILLVALILFFPIVINTSTGLTDVDKNHIYLLRSLGAGEGTIFRKVRLPNALPPFFDALRIAITGSMIGAIIAEFVSSSAGLGFLILNAQYNFKVDIAFASLTLLTVLGLVLYGCVEVAARIVMPWYRKQR